MKKKQKEFKAKNQQPRCKLTLGARATCHEEDDNGEAGLKVETSASRKIKIFSFFFSRTSQHAHNTRTKHTHAHTHTYFAARFFVSISSQSVLGRSKTVSEILQTSNTRHPHPTPTHSTPRTFG